MSTTPLVDKRMFLGANPLFGEFTAEELRDLESITTIKQFGAHSEVVRQGQPGEEMYIIESGSVNILLHLADQEDVVIGKLCAGEAFGEIALFDEQPRTATAVTCEPCRLLAIGRQAFNGFLTQNPQAAVKLLAVMSRRLRAASDFLRDSLYTDVAARLATTLRNIAKAYGKNTSKGLQIDTTFDAQELGNIAGVPGDLVKAQLRHWCAEGVINMRHGYLTIVKPEVLAEPVQPA